MRHHSPSIVVSVLFCGSLALPPVAAQIVTPREPPPEGRRILAADGDVIVVANDDRVRVVRRREAAVRVIADEAHSFVVILADWSAGSGPTSDGQVDRTWRFSTIDGGWPFEPRWEGVVTIEEQDRAFGGPTLALETRQGTIWFTGGGPQPTVVPAEVVAAIRHKSAGSGTTQGSFDEVEQREVLLARDPARAVMSARGSQSGAYAASVMASIEPGVPGSGSQEIAGGAMRVGAGVTAPTKIHHVQPQMSEEARSAGVRGVVILEIRIEPDGSVSAARILRSIPMLDESALRAVRQWRFAPTRVNGQPVALVMTATVDFR